MEWLLAASTSLLCHPWVSILTPMFTKSINNQRLSLHNHSSHDQLTLHRKFFGASPSIWSSFTWRPNSRRTTHFHRDLWIRKLFNPPSPRDPLRFRILHRPHPAATAGCLWGVVDGKTNLHRLPHTECDVWSVGTRYIHQWAPRRWRSRCDQHGRSGRVCCSPEPPVVPCTGFSILG